MPLRAPLATHFTTRRAFVAATGFGGLGLYGLWAAYGAAPGPLALLGLDGEHAAAASPGRAAPHGAAQSSVIASSADTEGGAHGGHGAGAAGPDAEAFRRMTDAFVERYRLPDGSVHPRRMAAPAPSGHDAHAAHGSTMVMDEPMAGAPIDAPIEIPMVAGRWYYLPATLRLDAGQAYRFRMMAVDMSHGASIQFGKGARMARLRPGRETSVQTTFREPGRYFMYCTVYCGAAHDLMQASIEVI